MKKLILLIIFLISSYSYYGAVNEKGERVYSYDNLTKAENVVETGEQKEKTEVNQPQKSVTVSSQPVKEKQTETNTEQQVIETPKVHEQVVEQTKQEQVQQPVQEKPVVNETKYVRNDAMIERIRQVINNNATEDMKNYGYNIVVDSSIKNSVNQFTFTENRVKNMIRYSFGTIKIYAEDYYSNGQLIMTECYIL